jgi:hypothetical protein
MFRFLQRRISALENDRIGLPRSGRTGPSSASILGTALPLLPENHASSRFSVNCPRAMPTPALCPFGGACHACPARAQAKLMVSQPNDPYEQEADRFADQAAARPEPKVQRACPSCEDETVQTKALVQHQGANAEKEKEPAQAKHENNPTPRLTSGMAPQIRSLREGGVPLPSATRVFFEQRFGSDFHGVRVHSGPQASRAAKAVRAQAFTLGRDIVFGQGRYAPETSSGRRLIAHELSHVLQQRNGGHPPLRLQRLVRERFVSCRNPTPAIAAITGNNPVRTISDAAEDAIDLLDSVIEDLDGTREDILDGEPAALPTISHTTATSLRNRFGVNPFNRRFWTRRGAESAFVLIRRLRASRRLLNDGWLRFTCLGPARLNLRTCEGECCTGDTRAATCEGITRIWLCRPFWDDTGEDNALTLLHEGFHIYYGFIGDEERRNFGNAHCYEQFVRDAHSVPVGRYAGMCRP